MSEFFAGGRDFFFGGDFSRKVFFLVYWEHHWFLEFFFGGEMIGWTWEVFFFLESFNWNTLGFWKGDFFLADKTKGGFGEIVFFCCESWGWLNGCTILPKERI